MLTALRSVLAEARQPGDVVAARALAGGAVNDTWEVGLADGARLVVKATTDAPDGMFAAEADGLRVLSLLGGMPTPSVLAAGTRWLVLEALGPVPADPAPAFWEAAGRAVARLHAVRGRRFGWAADGWLGLLPQRNAWCDDGHEFFASRRVLRYLSEPKVTAALRPASRAALERMCARLRDLVPAGPPALTHGDLWRGNMVSGHDGGPVFIDPAVCWMWAETDIAMMYCTDVARAPARFFDAYHEVHPPEPGWRDRMPILHLREMLSTIAHFGPEPVSMAGIERVIRPFRTR